MKNSTSRMRKSSSPMAVSHTPAVRARSRPRLSRSRRIDLLCTTLGCLRTELYLAWPRRGWIISHRSGRLRLGVSAVARHNASRVVRLFVRHDHLLSHTPSPPEQAATPYDASLTAHSTRQQSTQPRRHVHLHVAIRDISFCHVVIDPVLSNSRGSAVRALRTLATPLYSMGLILASHIPSYRSIPFPGPKPTRAGPRANSRSTPRRAPVRRNLHDSKPLCLRSLRRFQLSTPRGYLPGSAATGSTIGAYREHIPRYARRLTASPRSHGAGPRCRRELARASVHHHALQPQRSAAG